MTKRGELARLRVNPAHFTGIFTPCALFKMFDIGDKIFYPMHGAGIIEDIVEKDVLGETKKYFVVKLPYTTMNISIPYDKIDTVHIRKILDCEQARALLRALKAHTVCVNENWNARYRENLDKVMKSDLFEIGKVVKELILREQAKPLSTGERKMLASAKNIFLSEIVLALDENYEDAEALIEKII